MGTISRPGSKLTTYRRTRREAVCFPFNKQDFEHIGLHLLHAQVKHIDPHGTMYPYKMEGRFLMTGYW